MEDLQIIALYWQRDPKSIEETNQKYGAYCYAIANQILDNREDSEECVNDTWLQAWNRIPPHRPDVFRMFLARITRCIAFNRFKANSAKKRGGGQLMLALEELTECLPDENNVEDMAITAELRESIRQFVRALPEREGDIFTRRYFFTEPIQVIAKEYGLTASHTMVILSRTRQKLRQHLIKEEYFYESKRSL